MCEYVQHTNHTPKTNPKTPQPPYPNIKTPTPRLQPQNAMWEVYWYMVK